MSMESLMSKLSLSTAGAIGYVLGARAGRGRYEQIATVARRVWNDPRVQQATTRAQNRASETVRSAVPLVSAKVKSTVSGNDNDNDTVDQPVTVATTGVTAPVAPDQDLTDAPVSTLPDDTIGGPA
jgi:predicted naringenin-chalcone synthase